jgi:uncharacterized tellurite resistance protein B-like protein
MAKIRGNSLEIDLEMVMALPSRKYPWRKMGIAAGTAREAAENIGLAKPVGRRLGESLQPFEHVMLQQILAFLSAGAPPRTEPDRKLAVAVLLVEAAYRDDTFSPQERGVIARLLNEKFGLTDGDCEQLLSDAEGINASMTQLHPYTRVVFEQMTPAERIELIEMMWEVAYADGVLDPEEDALIRRLGNLIYITDRDRVLARQRVLARKR